MAVVKLKRTKTVVETVSVTYPDWYPQDTTPVGLAVDVLLKTVEYIKDPTGYRIGIYSDDADRVEAIVEKLNKYYSIAHQIGAAFGLKL